MKQIEKVFGQKDIFNFSISFQKIQGLNLNYKEFFQIGPKLTSFPSF